MEPTPHLSPQLAPLLPLLRRQLGPEGEIGVHAPIQHATLQDLHPLGDRFDGRGVRILTAEELSQLHPGFTEFLKLSTTLISLRSNHATDLVRLFLGESQPVLHPLHHAIPDELAVFRR